MVRDRSCVAVFVRDTTATRQAARRAAALGQSAVAGGAGEGVTEALTAIAERAVESTRAVACSIDLRDPASGLLSPAAKFGIPGELDEAVGTHEEVAFEDLPMYGEFLRLGKPAVIADITALVPAMRANPLTEQRGDVFAGLGWQAALFVPLWWRDDVLGVAEFYFPSGVSEPTESETAFLSSMGDQAALAVVTARMRAKVSRISAHVERQRLARELHDSVSQAVHAMLMHARAAELALARDGRAEDAAARSVREVAALGKVALAEMRALIFELRPETLAEEGLGSALEKQAAALGARERLAVTVTGPIPPLTLPAGVEEHVYRVVLEALNNIVRHAGATRADVRLDVVGDMLTVVVRDDGAGFDPTLSRPGHLGMTSMRDRAGVIGAELDVRSRSGAGTTVTLRLPLAAPAVPTGRRASD